MWWDGREISIFYFPAHAIGRRTWVRNFLAGREVNGQFNAAAFMKLPVYGRGLVGETRLEDMSIEEPTGVVIQCPLR